MPADLLQAKHSLRQQAREKLAALAAGDIADMSARIVARILDQSDLLQPGSAISLFGGIKGEPDLSPLIAELVAQEISPVYFGFSNGELVPQIVTSTDQLIPRAFRCARSDQRLPRDRAFGARRDTHPRASL